MMRTTGLVLLLAAAATGCATADEFDDSWGDEEAAGKLDSFRDSGTVFFVYANQRVCVTAPCPSYTVITPGAVRFDVARVVTEGAGKAVTPLLTTGGALVNGRVQDGSWKPGRKGPALVVEEAIEPAGGHMVVKRPLGAVHPFLVETADENEYEVDRIDLEGFVASDLGTNQTLATLVKGEWAAKGFVAHGDTGEMVFFATTGAGVSFPYAVRASGIECVTDPCPVWSLESLDGKQLGYASELDLGCLQLGEEETAKIFDQLFSSGGAVYGWLAGEALTEGSGDVLLVVRLL